MTAPRVVFANDLPYSDGQEDPAKSLRDTLAFAVDDWGASRAMAWVWGIVHGWDDEAMAELAANFRWDAATTARLNRLRESRAKNAGRRRAVRHYLLAKRLWCACGRAIAADTARQRNGAELRRYRHEDCPLGGKVTWKASHYEDPVAAQVAGIRLDAATLVRIREIAGRPAPATSDLRRAQLERELGRKAADHAARRITTEAYLAEHARLTTTIDALAPAPAGAPVDDADEVVARLRRLRETWSKATDEARAALVGRIYSRVVVAGGRFVRAELTDDAKRWGLAIALPETVVLARPARAGVGQSTAERIRIPIEGRAAWLRAARSA